MKKLISIALALIMILSSFAAITVSADDGASQESTQYANNVELTAADLAPADGSTAKTFTLAENTRYYLADDMDISKLLIADITLKFSAGSCLDGQGYGFYNVGEDGNRLSADDNGNGIDGWFRMNVDNGGTIQDINFGDEDRVFGTWGYFLADTGNKAATNKVQWHNVHFNIENNANTRDWAYGLGNIRVSHEFLDCTMTYNDPRDGRTRPKSWMGNAEADGYTVSFTNCVLNGSMARSTSTMSGFINTISKAVQVTFTNCTNNMEISLSNSTGIIGGFVNEVNNANATVAFDGCVNNMKITGITPSSCISGFIGNVSNAKTVTFEDCTNYADLSTSSGTIWHWVAGFCRVNNSAEGVTFTNCVNYGDIDGDAKNMNAAGIAVIRGGNADFENCKNYGDINGQIRSAGIAVRANAEANCSSTITNCENYGAIHSKHSYAQTEGKGGAGGIVMTWTDGSTAGTLTVDNCLNLGAVTSVEGGLNGGIVGNVEVNNTIAVTVKNSYSFGETSNTWVGNGTLTESTNNMALADYETLADAVAAINAENFSNEFIVDGDAIAIAPTLRAVQETTPDGDAQSVRFIGVINSESFTHVGFKVITTRGDNAPVNRGYRYCQNVYTSVIGGGNTYTAENLGGKYIFAYAFDGVPTDGTLASFEIVPFAIDADGNEYLGASYTVQYQNGNCVRFALTEVAA